MNEPVSAKQSDLLKQSDPSQSRRTTRRDLFLVLLAGIILNIPFLGLRDIWTSGEARVAQVARQMRQPGGNWIIPELGDEPRLKKPPLAYWLTAIASMPFDDVDEFNSRLPNAISAIGLMLIIYLLGAGLFDRRAGLVSAVACGTTGILWTQARTTGIEMPLLFFNVLALFAWWKYHAENTSDKNPPSPKWLLIGYFSLGLSALQKGPVGPPLVLIVILSYLWATGGLRWSRFSIKNHTFGIALLLAMSLPWPLIVMNQLANAEDIWQKESLGRFEGFDHIKTSFYFHIKSLGDGMPWILVALPCIMIPSATGKRKIYRAFLHLESLFALLDISSKIQIKWALSNDVRIMILVGMLIPTTILVHLFYRRTQSFFNTTKQADDAESDKAVLFPIIWMLVCLAFFSIPASKKSYYILPIYPAFALMAGAAISAACRDTSGRAAGALVMLSKIVGGVLFVSALAAYPLWEMADYMRRVEILDFSPVYREHTLHLVIYAVIAGLLGAALWVAGKNRRFTLAAASLALAATGCYGIMTSLLPYRNAHKADKETCQFLRPYLEKSPDARIYTYDTSGLPIFIFYLDHPVTRLFNSGQVQEIFNQIGNRTSYWLMEQKNLIDLQCVFSVRAAIPSGKTIDREGMEDADANLSRILGKIPNAQIVASHPAETSPWPKNSFGVKANVAAKEMVISKTSISIAVNLVGKEGKVVRNQEEARKYLSENLSGADCHIEALGDRFERLPHEVFPNKCMWVKVIPSPLDNRPEADYVGDPGSTNGK